MSVITTRLRFEIMRECLQRWTLLHLIGFNKSLQRIWQQA